MRKMLALLLAIFAVPAIAQEPAAMRGYQIKGAAALWPAEIGDDGARTYIRWREDQPLPATFAIGAGGREELVEGHVRGGVFTIDRVYERLVFRIDKLAVTARRLGS